MRRREFLRSLAVSAACAGGGLRAFGRARSVRVGIIGGGIVGASCAYQLARRGAHVVLIEKAALASGASRKSSAWLNAFVADPEERALRLMSLQRYHALDQALGLNIAWGGYMDWTRAHRQMQQTRASAERRADALLPVRATDGNGIERYAAALAPTAANTFFSRVDGQLSPPHVTRALASAARKLGAEVVLQAEVVTLDADETRIWVRGPAVRKTFDRLIIAAGAGTPELVSQLPTFMLGRPRLHANGSPIVGALRSRPRAFVADTHSDITLAPVLGEMLSEEIARGVCRHELGLIGPQRCSQASSA